MSPMAKRAPPRTKSTRKPTTITTATGMPILCIVGFPTGQNANSRRKAMDKRDHKQRYDSGLKTRREVLGAGYVDKAMAGVDEFTTEFTEMLNTSCWNDVWNRPGLPRKTRSILNLGMLCALGKEHELKL